MLLKSYGKSNEQLVLKSKLKLNYLGTENPDICS